MRTKKIFRSAHYFDSGKFSHFSKWGIDFPQNGVNSYPSKNDQLFPNWTTIKEHEQSTGLTDKNGNEIFEGDVVKVTGGWSGDFIAKERTSEVVYDDNEFYAACDRDGSWWIDCEVLGNIHENPELLNNQKQ